jgi:hypothetical protein
MTFRFDPGRYTSAPQQTEGLVRFAGSPDAVFDRIANHTALTDWVPLLKTIHVTHPKPLPPGQSMVGTTRVLTLRGGVTVQEEVVRWDPPRSYAYTAEGKRWPMQDYVGLMGVKPETDGGTFVFREYFNVDGVVRQAAIPPGMVILGKRALNNLSRLIGGTSVQMRRVRARHDD